MAGGPRWGDLSSMSTSFGFCLHEVIDVAAYVTNVDTVGLKQGMWQEEMPHALCVSQVSKYSTTLTPQTGSVPVSV